MGFSAFLTKHKILLCVIILVIALIFIVIVGRSKSDKLRHVMTTEFFTLPGTTIDFWSLSHLVLYMFLGFVFPGAHMKFFLLGCAFEIVEDALANDKLTQLSDCTGPDKDTKIMCMLSMNSSYSYAKWDDTLINLLGYTIGSSLRTTFFKDEKKN